MYQPLHSLHNIVGILIVTSFSVVCHQCCPDSSITAAAAPETAEVRYIHLRLVFDETLPTDRFGLMGTNIHKVLMFAWVLLFRKLIAAVLIGTVLTRHYAPFVYKPSLTICMNLLLMYIYLQYTPPLASATPTNERKIRTHHTTLYMKSIYLIASDTPTKWLASGGRLIASWWWCKNCIVFSDHSHSAPSLIIS